MKTNNEKSSSYSISRQAMAFRIAPLAGTLALVGSSLAMFGSGTLLAGAAPISPVTATSSPSPSNPATSATTTSDVVVPNGVCRGSIQARGGNGEWGNEGGGRDTGGGGDGAIITAAYDMTPGQTVNVRRHAGGPVQDNGNNGGQGGDAIEVRVNGTMRVLPAVEAAEATTQTIRAMTRAGVGAATLVCQPPQRLQALVVVALETTTVRQDQLAAAEMVTMARAATVAPQPWATVAAHLATAVPTAQPAPATMADKAELEIKMASSLEKVAPAVQAERVSSAVAVAVAATMHSAMVTMT